MIEQKNSIKLIKCVNTGEGYISERSALKNCGLSRTVLKVNIFYNHWTMYQLASNRYSSRKTKTKVHSRKLRNSVVTYYCKRNYYRVIDKELQLGLMVHKCKKRGSRGNCP